MTGPEETVTTTVTKREVGVTETTEMLVEALRDQADQGSISQNECASPYYSTAGSSKCDLCVDGYYYNDLNFDEYAEKFAVRKHAFGREDRLQGLSVTQKLSRFQARREPVTGLPARGRSGRDPRDMSDVKPHRGGDRL